MTLFNMGILYFNGVLLKLNTCFFLFYITKTNITFCTLQLHVDLQLPLYPKKTQTDHLHATPNWGSNSSKRSSYQVLSTYTIN